MGKRIDQIKQAVGLVPYPDVDAIKEAIEAIGVLQARLSVLKEPRNQTLSFKAYLAALNTTERDAEMVLDAAEENAEDKNARGRGALRRALFQIMNFRGVLRSTLEYPPAPEKEHLVWEQMGPAACEFAARRHYRTQDILAATALMLHREKGDDAFGICDDVYKRDAQIADLERQIVASTAGLEKMLTFGPLVVDEMGTAFLHLYGSNIQLGQGWAQRAIAASMHHPNDTPAMAAE